MSVGRKLLLIALVGSGLALPGLRHGTAPAQSPDRAANVDVSSVLVGRVTRVADGDSIEVFADSGPIRVRLHGIDTPESSQPWGREARVELLKRVEGRDVDLQPMGQDRYDRLLAVIYLGSENINRWLVQEGYAWAYRQHLEDPTYCDLEAVARRQKRGLWKLPDSEWIAPWQWRMVQAGKDVTYTDYRRETAEDCKAAMRRAQAERRPDGRAMRWMPPAPAVPQALSKPDCPIKGNINSKGERIYHSPGMPSYEETVIDEPRGERWFCKEQDARDAGWRPPR